MFEGIKLTEKMLTCIINDKKAFGALASAEAAKEALKSIKQLQKAFVLACRCIADNFGCPAADCDANFPECNGEMDKCGDNALWKCWQRYFAERVENEAVCRICGCTQNNACEGGCYWVEQDLCSKCDSYDPTL